MTGPANHILVDANVARSATDPARHPTSMACWSLAKLLASRDCLTGVLMTPVLREEWKEHASPTMTGWLASMVSRRRVRQERDAPVRDLRDAVSDIKDDGVRQALEKDLHLSEAAVLHAVPVASQDDRQRGFLRDLSESYELVGKVQWVNPVTDVGWEGWIATGCMDREPFRCCGTS